MVFAAQAREAVAAIVKTIRPISIVLYGSTARQAEGNDLDLMIVVDGPQESVAAVQMALYRCLAGAYKRYAVDPLVVTKSAVQRALAQNSPFLRLVAREGRVLYMKNAEQDWMHQAGQELKMADYLLQGGFHQGCCYHAQQAIEKGIKARLLARGWELEKTHSIARLMAICRDFKIRLRLKDEDIVFIDGIYRGRYPAEEGLLPLKEPALEDAQRAIRIAGRIIKSSGRKTGEKPADRCDTTP